jgi:hypothetical protein
MDMVRHQTPGEQAGSGVFQVPPNQVKVGFAV